jgi:hypothetical protein
MLLNPAKSDIWCQLGATQTRCSLHPVLSEADPGSHVQLTRVQEVSKGRPDVIFCF